MTTFGDEHLDRLAAVLDFTPEDLEANQDGALSEHQVLLLARDLRWQYWPIIGGLCFFLFISAATSISAGTFAVMPVGLLAVAAAVVAFLLRHEQGILPGKPVRATLLRMGKISLLAGRLGLRSDGPNERVRFPVENGQHMIAPDRLHHALRANFRYRVYYAQLRTWGHYRILSIEPLGEHQPPVKPKHKAKRKAKREVA